MYQKLILLGNCGGDPELKYLPDGNPVCSFSLAVNKSYTDNDGKKTQQTTWFRVVAFSKLATTCSQYLKKGNLALIEGELKPDKETGTPKIFARKDGTYGAGYDVVAHNVRFIGGQKHEEEPMDDQSIPF